MKAQPVAGPGRARIYTFYSLETGPARSMALAGVATRLASRGQRLLLVDWDIEGPGLERFLPGASALGRGATRPPPDIVELAEAHRSGNAIDWRECIVEVPVNGDGLALHQVTAGWRDGRHGQGPRRLDWESLFVEADFGNYLERLRTEWAQEYDLVLIDSRAGVSDVAAICTVYLPDVLVALYSASHASVESIADVVRRARRARSALPFDRGHLVVLPVPSGGAEGWNAYTQLGGGMRVITEHLGELYRDILPREVGVEEAVEVLRVPGDPERDLGERVSGESAGGREELVDSYAVLAGLVGSGLRWDASTQPETAATAGSETADFFISYSDADRQWATWIAWLLEHAGYRVLIWAWDFVPGPHVVERMGRGVRAAARTIAILSPAYLRTVYGRAEWEAAYASDPRELERKLLPVRVAQCQPAGMLAGIKPVDLVGIDDETAAGQRLLEAASEALGEQPKPGLGPFLPANVGGSGRPPFPRHMDVPGQDSSEAGAETSGDAVRPRAIAGMTAWVSARARGSQRQVRRLTPAGVAASLTAAALASVAHPLTAEDGDGPALSAVVRRLGAADGHLAGLVADVAVRIREGRTAPSTREDLRDALGDELLRRLGEAGAERLRREVAALLRSLGAVETALRAARDTGALDLHERLALAFMELGGTYVEFARLREDVLRTLDSLQRGVTEVVFSGRDRAELNRRTLQEVTLLRQRALASRTAAERSTQPDGRRGDTSDEVCPYRGLAPFQVHDARWFHGRAASTVALVSRLAERLSGPSLVMVVGASGAGKSSLLNAGLLPALRSGMLGVPGSETWPYVLMHPGPSPVSTLARHVAEMAGIPADTVEQDLRADPARFASAVHRAAGGRGTRRLLLVVDQFEELFTLCHDPAEQRDFIRALCAIASPLPQTGTAPAAVVLGLRADRYAECTAHPELMAAQEGGQVVVGPMTVDELRVAIERPAEEAGLSLEPGLVEVILHDLDPRLAAGQHGYDPGRLPLLSHALLATWQQRRSSRLDLAGYQAAGGIDRAVTNTADQLYEGLSPDGQREVRRLLLRMVVVTENAAEDARARVRRADLLQEDVAGLDRGGSWSGQAADLGPESDRLAVESALNVLVGARLVTCDEDHCEITHEALLHAWPRLRSWIDENRDWLALRRHLSDAAAAWERAQRHPSELYGPIRVAQVHEKIDTARRAELGPLEAAFLTASEEQVARQEQNQRRRVRRRRALAGLLVALLIVTAFLAALAWQQKTIADERRNVADSRQVAAEADALRATDPGIAAQLDVQAFRIAPTTEARSSLLSTRAPFYTELPTTGRPNGVAVGPDGRFLAAAGQNGTIELWDLVTHARVTLGSGTASPVYTVAFSPDGATVAGADSSGTVALWDVASRERTVLLTGSRLAVNAVAFSPDSRMVVTGGGDGTVRLWDARSGAQIAVLVGAAGPTGPIDGVAFSPDGHTVASAGADTTVVLWDVARRSQAAVLTGHTLPVRAVAFSEDGHTLASAGDDGSVLLWDVDRRALAAIPYTAMGAISAVAFAPDGRTLAAGGRSGAVRLWRVGSLAPLASLAGPVASILGLAFGPDGTLAAAEDSSTIGLWDLGGSFLADQGVPGQVVGVSTVTFGPRVSGLVATVGAGRTIRLWHASDGSPYGTIPTGAPDTAATEAAGGPAVRFAMTSGPDGRTLLATPAGAGAVALWDVGSRQQIATLTVAGDNQPVRALAFSPDGRLLAAASSGPQVRLWNVQSHQVAGQITDAYGAINALAFSPDGRVLASASNDGTISLSDVRSSRLIAPLFGHLGAVQAVAFSPDGTTVASGGGDGTVRLWSAASHEQIVSLAGHAGTVVSVAFGPDGRTLASAGDDRTVRLWTLPDRAPLAVLRGQADVTTVAYAPDGSTLVGADRNGRTLSWDIDAGRTAERICSGRARLTPSQWQQYMPSDQAYRSTCP